MRGEVALPRPGCEVPRPVVGSGYFVNALLEVSLFGMSYNLLIHRPIFREPGLSEDGERVRALLGPPPLFLFFF